MYWDGLKELKLLVFEVVAPGSSLAIAVSGFESRSLLGLGLGLGFRARPVFRNFQNVFSELKDKL